MQSLKPSDSVAGGAEQADVTAAVLVIGDEILSGRTADTNIATLARHCTAIGIRLQEVRVVADRQAAIVAAVNALRAANDYVFTTGGIGPTHDDITADAIGAAFDLPVAEDARALALLAARYGADDLTPARRRMARVPHGATLIENSVSAAPGFRVGNVIVMAGVPTIMRAMLEAVSSTLRTGRIVVSASLTVHEREGSFAGLLAQAQAAHPAVALGSYPFQRGDSHGAVVIARHTDAALAQAALSEFRARLDAAGIASEPGG